MSSFGEDGRAAFGAAVEGAQSGASDKTYGGQERRGDGRELKRNGEGERRGAVASRSVTDCSGSWVELVLPKQRLIPIVSLFIGGNTGLVRA